ncbi:ARO2 [Symbiodinium sp. KB8]|nr:ARO2 [Symbiodinium sp. KB8]
MLARLVGPSLAFAHPSGTVLVEDDTGSGAPGLCSRGPSLEMSSFGTLFKVSTFGESHGVGVGCIVDGIPANLALTEEDVQPQLTRRRPGQSSLTTVEKENVTGN